MVDDTAAQTHVCYDNYTFYVVDVQWNAAESQGGGLGARLSLETLPGGTFENMQNPLWAGLTLDDFVISTWNAYKMNGMQNGYSLQQNGTNDWSYNETGILFGDGVRTPGFAVLPLVELEYLLTHPS
jgi:hypothetical protein